MGRRRTEKESKGDATRAAILAVLEDEGAIQKADLCRRIGRGWGNVVHHLQVLEKAGALWTRRHGRNMWLVRPGMPDEAVDRIIVLSWPERRRLLGLMRHRDRSVRELTDEMGANIKAVRRHLAHLEAVDLIGRIDEGPPRRYEAMHAEPSVRDLVQSRRRR